MGGSRRRDLRNGSKSSNIVKKSDLGRETSKELGSRRLRGHFEANLGPTLRPTWAQLGANLGLRRGCFPLWGENDKICTALKREHDFRPPGGVQDGPRFGPEFDFRIVFGRRCYFEAVLAPLEASSGRLGADLGPTWGRLGANLGPQGGPRGGPEGVQNRSWRPPGPKRSFGGHLGPVWVRFGGQRGV